MFLENKYIFFKQLLRYTRRFHSSNIKNEYEGPGKTTVNIVNLTDTSNLFVNKCLQIGFKMNDDSLIIGPIVIFPKGILSWNVGSIKDINEESLSLFTILKPQLDILILGLESNYEYRKILKLKELLLKLNIKNEILPVESACGVYNFLVSEGRYAAAGLIPPQPTSKENMPLNLNKNKK